MLISSVSSKSYNLPESKNNSSRKHIQYSSTIFIITLRYNGIEKEKKTKKITLRLEKKF